MNDLKVGKCVVYKNEPYIIQYTQHVQMGRGSAILRTKLKNLISGIVIEDTFKGGDKLDEADLSRKKAQFMYRDGDDFYFMDEETYDQFPLPKDHIGEINNYIKEGQAVDILYYDEKPVLIYLPPKVELKVISAPEGARGNTAQGSVTKPATLETGYECQVPLFVKDGDMIRVNTDTGTYVERVS